MSTSSPDRWLLPRRQTEFPLRDLLPEEVLHARREATFLVLAVIAVLPVAMLVLGGVGHVIDLSAVLGSLGIESPIALALPVGVAPFAVGLVAVAIVCELFGRRRARALVWVAAVSAIALVGFVRLVDVVDGGAAFGAGLALAAACVVAEIVHVLVFDGLRRMMRGRGRFVRFVVATGVACAAGFAAFDGVASLEVGSALAPISNATAIAAGAAAWSLALAVVLAIAAAVAVRMLAVTLRVGREMVVQRDAMALEVVAPARVSAAAPAFAREAPVTASMREAPAAAPFGAEAPATAAFMTEAPAARSALYERSARGTPAIALDRAPRTTLQGVVRPGAAAEGSAARRLPPAEIVEEDVVALEADAMRQRPARVSLQPFSSAEMQFFNEGDSLE